VIGLSPKDKGKALKEGPPTRKKPTMTKVEYTASLRRSGAAATLDSLHSWRKFTSKDQQESVDMPQPITETNSNYNYDTNSSLEPTGSRTIKAEKLSTGVKKLTSTKTDRVETQKNRFVRARSYNINSHTSVNNSSRRERLPDTIPGAARYRDTTRSGETIKILDMTAFKGYYARGNVHSTSTKTDLPETQATASSGTESYTLAPDQDVANDPRFERLPDTIPGLARYRDTTSNREALQIIDRIAYKYHRSSRIHLQGMSSLDDQKKVRSGSVVSSSLSKVLPTSTQTSTRSIKPKGISNSQEKHIMTPAIVGLQNKTSNEDSTQKRENAPVKTKSTRDQLKRRSGNSKNHRIPPLPKQKQAFSIDSGLEKEIIQK
jgi:hypothetical protein